MPVAKWKKKTLFLSAALLLNVASGVVMAEEHSHSHSNGEQAQLVLNDGQKWATDDALRQAMARIRDMLAAELPAIHSGKATPEQYRALSNKASDQITFMVKNCRLEQQADAMLHLVLADIIAGADAMAGQDGKAARSGAVKIVRALDNYGAYFEHPDWHGVMHGH